MRILEKAEKLRYIAKKLAHEKRITEQEAWSEANNLLRKIYEKQTYSDRNIISNLKEL